MKSEASVLWVVAAAEVVVVVAAGVRKAREQLGWGQPVQCTEGEGWGVST